MPGGLWILEYLVSRDSWDNPGMSHARGSLWILKYLTLMQDHMVLYQEINFGEYNHFKVITCL